MQAPRESDTAALLDRLVSDALPEGRGLDAWRCLLRAHAALMRRLDSDLRDATGLGLGDFDVLAQLALAGGELRMTELAARALSSRSGMTRRVDRLVEQGLIRRDGADADGRGVVVALTDAGVARLKEIVPIHLRGVSELFVARLDDRELAALETALTKVTRPLRLRLRASRGLLFLVTLRGGLAWPTEGISEAVLSTGRPEIRMRRRPVSLLMAHPPATSDNAGRLPQSRGQHQLSGVVQEIPASALKRGW